MTEQPSDQELVGEHSPLDQLDPLTDAERARLTSYWRHTHNLEECGGQLLAQFLDNSISQQSTPDPGPLHELLANWRIRWQALRDWQYVVNHARAGDLDRNPVAKRLRYDDSIMTGLAVKLRERER
jgi:hypothetical protein